MMIAFFLIFVVFTQYSVESFRIHNTRLMMAQNYQSLLQEALQARQKSSNPIQQTPTVNSSIASTSTTATTATTFPSNPISDITEPFQNQNTNYNQQAWIGTNEPKTARDKASFKNKIPFNEDMYEILKSSIEILSDRMNTKQPLTTEQAVWLSNAIEIIIEDANKYGPPPKPIRSANMDENGDE